MKLKHLIICGILAATASLGASADDNGVVDPDSTGFKFTDITVVGTTPVKDQNKSGTCWCFSAVSFYENEILRKYGKELDISEMYIVRKCYEDKARKYLRMYGAINFAEGGSVLDAEYVMRNYGTLPEEIYPGINYGDEKHNHRELSKVLDAYVKAIAQKPNKKLSTAWYNGLLGILDAYLGAVPETFEYDNATYTPQSYQESLGLDLDDYIGITSFSHHPFYEPFILEVADNWLWGSYYNVQMQELQEIVDNAINNGYSVVWGADVSETGFKWRKGYALMPKAKEEKDFEGTELSKWVQVSDSEREKMKYEINGPVEEIEVTQESRQDMFEYQETTDDHGMVIVGIAEDQEGNRYYKVKNSWDTNQLYGGYFYVSMPYFLAKTMSIYLNREGVPAGILSKLK